MDRMDQEMEFIHRDLIVMEIKLEMKQKLIVILMEISNHL